MRVHTHLILQYQERSRASRYGPTCESKDAKTKAHKSPEVMALWNRMMELGTNIPLKKAPETGDVFANFKAI